MLGQGRAFIAALSPWPSTALAALVARVGAERIAYPVAVGAACASHSIAEDGATIAYLTALTTNLVSAAVRLIPLGQSAGLAVLAALEETILRISAATRAVTLEDLGGVCFRADIAAMRHETQSTRLFRS
jgi:urease accessory protein